ncbi:hypothetical protein [uncultured Prevotella sp.]|uniref:hypothetical protein n=1 Tax=uncultured Prevotella sp. TaxID=159272 RepID=UPI0026740AB6|nr:hypothetical protein [uncultured Prevotella sp.]
MKKNSTNVTEGIVGGAGVGAVGGTASAICTTSQVAMAGASVTAGVIAAPLLICVGLGAIIGGIAAANGSLD